MFLMVICREKECDKLIDLSHSFDQLIAMLHLSHRIVFLCDSEGAVERRNDFSSFPGKPTYYLYLLMLYRKKLIVAILS